VSPQSNQSSQPQKSNRAWFQRIAIFITGLTAFVASMVAILSYFRIEPGQPTPIPLPVSSTAIMTTTMVSALTTATLVPVSTSTPAISTFKINKPTETHIRITKGDHIKITAIGSVCVGPVVGCVPPQGVGWVSDSYDIVQSYPHAALLCRINQPQVEEETAWELCGTRKILEAEWDGELEFNINDNKLIDNSANDYFDVEVTITNGNPP
jgi:hypothetical protein